MASATLTPRTRVDRERPDRAELRITRRGRLALTLVLMLLLASALVSVGLLRPEGAVAGDGSAPTAVVVVGAGDTLWGIAQQVDPERDPRAVIDEIERLNGLSGGVVVPGQALTVPA
jgi:LysM domain